MARIVVYGSINMDLVVRTAAMPAPGQTVLGRDFATIPGGKGANQAVACARLGAETHLAGAVGTDAFGDDLLASLAGNGVSTEAVRRIEGVPTGIAIIIVDEQGQNSIVVAGGANHQNSAIEVPALTPLLTEADALLVQLEVPLPALEAVMTLARRVGARVVLDAGPARPLPAGFVAAADIVSPNESETAALTGICPDTPEQAVAAADALLAQGAPAVVLKLGERGCLVRTKELFEHLPALPVQAVDTTAAGDAFTAALTVAVCEGADLVAGARYANAAGALAATAFGAQPSMPSRESLAAFIAERSST